MPGVTTYSDRGLRLQSGDSQGTIITMRIAILTFISSLSMGIIPAPLNPQPVSDIDISSSIVQVRSEANGSEEDTKVMAFCTGTMIEKDILLTANHCFSEFSYNPVVVIDGEDIPITRIIPHSTEDVALAYLEHDIIGVRSWSPVSVEKPEKGDGYHHYGLSGVNTPKRSTVHYVGNSIDREVKQENPEPGYGLGYDSRLKVTEDNRMGHGDSGGPFASGGMVKGMISAVAYERNRADMKVIEAQGTMMYDIAEWLEDNGVATVSPVD